MNPVKENKEKIKLFEDYIEKLRDVSKLMTILSVTIITIIFIITNLMVSYFALIFEPDSSIIIPIHIFGVLPTIVIIISLIYFVRLSQPLPIEYITYLDKKVQNLKINYDKKQKKFLFAKILFFLGIIICLAYIIMTGILM